MKDLKEEKQLFQELNTTEEENLSGGEVVAVNGPIVSVTPQVATAVSVGGISTDCGNVTSGGANANNNS